MNEKAPIKIQTFVDTKEVEGFILDLQVPASGRQQQPTPQRPKKDEERPATDYKDLAKRILRKQN